MNDTVLPFPKRIPEPDDLLTPAQLAKRWGVCRDSVYRLPPEVLPYVRLPVGKKRRYRLADVVAYEQTHTEGRER